MWSGKVADETIRSYKLQQDRACTASMPSRKIIGNMHKAATGSAHHHPNNAFSNRPPSKIADKYAQISVCRESATSARLLRLAATRRLARASSGITMRETTERTIPTRLASGLSRCSNDFPASNATYNASRKKLTPTILCASRSRFSSPSILCKRQSRILPDKLSMSESNPNPISAILSANKPAPTATVASAKFQVSVKYSSRRPRRSCSLRAVPARIILLNLTIRGTEFQFRGNGQRDVYKMTEPRNPARLRGEDGCGMTSSGEMMRRRPAGLGTHSRKARLLAPGWLTGLCKLLQATELSAKHAFYGWRDLLESPRNKSANTVRKLEPGVIKATG